MMFVLKNSEYFSRKMDGAPNLGGLQSPAPLVRTPIIEVVFSWTNLNV